MGGASFSIPIHDFSLLHSSSRGEIEIQEIVNSLTNTQMYNSPGISIALIFISVEFEPNFPQPLLINGYEGVCSFDTFLLLSISEMFGFFKTHGHVEEKCYSYSDQDRILTCSNNN